MKEGREGGRQGGGNTTKCYWFAADHEIEKIRIASTKFHFKDLFIG